MDVQNNKQNKAMQVLKRIAKMSLIHWKAILIGVACIIVAIAVVIIYSHFKGDDTEVRHEIVLVDTPIQIEDVRPRGEIYVCSAIMEDYTTVQKTELHLGIIKERHSCVQILTQKCSYKIDLDKVEYTPDTLNRVIVKLPKVEYVASTQNSPFMSDDESYWIKQLPNTNKLKQKVAKQIKQRFDTKSNRDKAELYAKEVISEMLASLGYEAVFESTVRTQKRD